MAKHSNSRFSVISPQLPRAEKARGKHPMQAGNPVGRAPTRAHPNSSSRADGIWLGAPGHASLTDPASAVGRFARFMPRTGDYP